jgi:sulfur-carrier protein
MIRVVLPAHLRTLARVGNEVQLESEGRVTQRSVLDALEARYPMLRGTIRDHVTQQRRPFVRFFACEEDWSLSNWAVSGSGACAGSWTYSIKCGPESKPY